jgi:hypothetical protein
MVEITNYPQIAVENIGKDSFESKEAGLKFEFNESKTELNMILNDGQKVLFEKD